MKKFIVTILSYLIATFLIMFALDFGYTKVYENAKPRTKFQYLRSLKNKQFDYIFLGSSRVENGIIPAIIKEKTGKETLNLGFQASKLNDIYTVLQLLKEYNIQGKRIFIQIDYIYNLKGNSKILQYQMIPFINENEVLNKHFKNNSKDYLGYNYVPFYRYSRNDLKLNFREILLSVAKKKTNAMQGDGYAPKYGTSENHRLTLPKELDKENIVFDSIIKYIEKNKINATFYCAPFCYHGKNMEFTTKLKNKVPNFYDFSRAVSDEKLFQNSSHLNHEGAIYFTDIFINQVLLKKKNTE